MNDSEHFLSTFDCASKFLPVWKMYSSIVSIHGNGLRQFCWPAHFYPDLSNIRETHTTQIELLQKHS